MHPKCPSAPPGSQPGDRTKGKLHAVARPTGTRGRRANGYFAAAIGRPTKTAPPTTRPVNDQ